MLLVRFRSDGNGFGVLPNSIFGLFRLRPVDDLSVLRGCSLKLSNVLVGEPGDGGEFACDVAAEQPADREKECFREVGVTLLGIEPLELGMAEKLVCSSSTAYEFDRRNMLRNLEPARFGGRGRPGSMVSGVASRLGAVVEGFEYGGVAGVFTIRGF